MKNKLLTGEMIHQSYQRHTGVTSEWSTLPSDIQDIYTNVAKDLMEALGLCDTCGEHPVAPNVLLEIAGEYTCSNCCNPPANESNPRIQYIHMATNANGEIIGALTPPAGMSLEDYRKQLTEEMSHISFVLEYNHIPHTAKTIPELYKLWCDVLPTPEHGQAHEYFIYVKKDNEEIGKGWYECASYDAFGTISEISAAAGLIDALYEYDLNHTTQEPAIHEN